MAEPERLRDVLTDTSDALTEHLAQRLHRLGLTPLGALAALWAVWMADGIFAPAGSSTVAIGTRWAIAAVVFFVALTLSAAAVLVARAHRK